MLKINYPLQYGAGGEGDVEDSGKYVSNKPWLKQLLL